MRAMILVAVMGLAACVTDEDAEAWAEDSSELSLTNGTYGVDDVGNFCMDARELTSQPSDEINTPTDADSYRFASDSAFHNYKASFAGVWGAVPLGCAVYYKTSYGTWALITSGGPTATADCTVSWTSSSAKTYCAKVWGLNGYAGPMQITLITHG